MIQEVAEPQRWPASRWSALIAGVLATQFGFIFWLGKPAPAVRRPPAELIPMLQLAGTGAVQMLALSDPTLFALPHRESFSGAAWLIIPPREFPPYGVTEPESSLPLVKAQLGADFESFMTTNQPENLPALEQPQLSLKLPRAVESLPLPERSRLRLAGGLADLLLSASPELPSWPAADLLTSSVVHVLIGTDGKPISATLLTKSGSAEADQYAVRAARRARFEPSNHTNPAEPLAGLTWGQMIFDWHTLPLPATNAPAETPQAK